MSDTQTIERASREGNEKAERAPRIYLSGPMSGHKDLNFAAFNAEATRLRALGFEVSNPAEINPEASKSWHECLRADVAELVRCDMVALLPGWERSEGAQLEQHLAHRLGLEVKRAEEIQEGPAGAKRPAPGAQGDDRESFYIPLASGELTFPALRAANMQRVGLFRNSQGDFAHSKPDGSDWSPAQWLQAVTGELGEYANVRKKFERGDMTEPEFLRLARDELADVVTYLDLLAARLGISLNDAVVSKFNRVSVRARAPVYIGAPSILNGVLGRHGL